MDINTTNTSLTEVLVEIINEYLKEAVISGTPFEQRRKWLTRYFGQEGADYPPFEASMPELITELKQEKPDKQKVRQLVDSCHGMHPGSPSGKAPSALARIYRRLNSLARISGERCQPLPSGDVAFP